MPDNGEKKSEQVLVNVTPAQRAELDRVAAVEDRKLGYVGRELMMRGLALYLRDGKLRDEPASGGVAATISSEKAELRRQFAQGMPAAPQSRGAAKAHVFDKIEGRKQKTG